MCICDEEAVGDSPSLLHTARGGQGGRTLRGKQAHGAGKWSACSGVWVCDGEAVDCIRLRAVVESRLRVLVSGRFVSVHM